MDATELDRYLHSLMLCTGYYYRHSPEVFIKRMESKTTDTSKIVKQTIMEKTIFYSPKNKKYTNNLNFIKNDLKSVLNEKESKTTDYLIKHLKPILDEYITKNNLDYIELNYFVGQETVYDGYGNIFIQTETDTFLIRVIYTSNFGYMGV